MYNYHLGGSGGFGGFGGSVVLYYIVTL